MRTDIRPVSAISDEFFAGATIDVAKRLIGAMLYRRLPQREADAGEVLAGRIVETEAYLPLVDPSCHGYRGPTGRNSVLFGRPGFAYVYLIYGIHFCLNVTTEPAGIGAAVLIRALQPTQGIDPMRKRRGQAVPADALACGPGNVCKALAIDLRDNGADLRGGDLRIVPPPKTQQHIAVSSRIGLTLAKDWPLRFYDPDSVCVSPFRKGRKKASTNGCCRR